MKQALIVTTISGFLPQFEMNDVKILQEKGYKIHYASNFSNPVYSFNKEDLEAKGIVLHPICIEKSPAKLLLNVKACFQLVKIIKREKIDLVHCHNPLGGVVGRMASAMSGRKPVNMYTAHGFHFYNGAPLKNWLLFWTMEKFLARKTDVLVTINKEDKQHAKKFKLRKNGIVKQIHGVGVNLQRFSPKPELAISKREELEVPQNAFHIVTVAEINENKNQTVVINAIASINRDDIYYTLCGKGNYEKELLELIKEKNLEGRVRLLGYRTDIPEVLQTADCFAFPSIREGLGIAAVEALACSVPLIAADNRGTREYLRDDFNGIVCNAKSVSDFREAILEMMTNENKRKRLASQCRETAMAFGMEENDRMMRLIYGEADKRVEGVH